MGIGWNSEGQLGDNTTINIPKPVQIGTDNNWVAISAGQSFSLTLKNDGTLWAWGLNSGGQLGFGNTTSTTIPLQVGNESDWLTVSSDLNHTIALKTNRTLCVS